MEAVRVIKKFNTEGVVDKFNWVNAANVNDTPMNKVQVRHSDKVGVLAHCFQVFASCEWNVQEVENIVFKQREACVASILFLGDKERAAEVREQLMANENILSVSF